ncbi:MAG TPA: short-chain dehydrogenase [Bacteroidetes bacterium]|nr:short-chain dehydrogenase [Bacteroidota bacterium]
METMTSLSSQQPSADANEHQTNAQQRGIVILGATSSIAMAIARLCCQPGSRFVLVGRSEENVSAVARDLLVRGATSCDVIVADLRAREQYDDIVQRSREILVSIDLVLIAHGVLPNQYEIDRDVRATTETFLVNGLSAITLAQMFCIDLADHGGGSLVVLSSVAGDRGRRSIYAYGAAKAALTQFASGLRAAWAQHNVHVMTVKPGPVDTPMTHGKKMPFKTTPEVVAKAVLRGLQRKSSTIYVPKKWRAIMWIVRHIPERIFMKLPF